MIIFFYGQDSYRSRQKLNEIIESYKKVHKSGLNLKYYDGEDFNARDLRDYIRQSSMFQEKKLMVFQNVFSGKDNKEKILDALKSLKESKDIVVFYEEKEAEKSNLLFRFLKKYGKCQEFPLLQGEKLRVWLKKEFAKYNAAISIEAENKLLNSAGNDLWQLSNEVQKLVNFKKGKRIIPEDVDILVRSKIEADIFKTIDAIAQKNKKQALFLIHKHIEKGDNPIYILSMINMQFRNLLMVKDLIEKDTPYYSLAQKSKLHPFVVKKSYEQARVFSFSELKKIYQKIFEVDLSVKTGKTEARVALDLFIAGI